MTRAEFLNHIEQMLELPKGNLKGDESLADLPEWDSLSRLKFILVMQEICGAVVDGETVSHARTMADLAVLAGDKVTG